jgi:hypothetical protein
MVLDKIDIYNKLHNCNQNKVIIIHAETQDDYVIAYRRVLNGTTDLALMWDMD